MRTLSGAAPGSPGAMRAPKAWANAPGRACWAQPAVGLPTYATSGDVSILMAPIRKPGGGAAPGWTPAIGVVLQPPNAAAATAPRLNSAARRVKTACI